MLFEIEQKVSYLSELSVHSESLLLEGRAETKEEAEQLTFKLRSLKDSLLELQQMLQDKQVDIQVRSVIKCVFHLNSALCFLLPASACLFLCFAVLRWTRLQHQWWYCAKSTKGHSCPFIKVHCFRLWNNNSLCLTVGHRCQTKGC